jgi:hypothetical protein
MAQDLFLMVMEAEGDLVQPFDANASDTSAPDTATTSPEQPPPEPDGMDEPPPLNQSDEVAPMDADMNDFGDDQSQQDENDDNQDGTKDGNEKLSEKANAILNQKLYQQFIDRNKEIEDILDNLQKLVPMLPYEVVKQNDGYVNRLKTALDKGKKYAIEKFVDSKYGENLLYFHKLDALYNLLEDEINKNLKSFETDDK